MMRQLIKKPFGAERAVISITSTRRVKLTRHMSASSRPLLLLIISINEKGRRGSSGPSVAMALNTTAKFQKKKREKNSKKQRCHHVGWGKLGARSEWEEEIKERSFG